MRDKYRMLMQCNSHANSGFNKNRHLEEWIVLQTVRISDESPFFGRFWNCLGKRGWTYPGLIFPIVFPTKIH